jgi:hypothetical protein
MGGVFYWGNPLQVNRASLSRWACLSIGKKRRKSKRRTENKPERSLVEELVEDGHYTQGTQHEEDEQRRRLRAPHPFSPQDSKCSSREYRSASYSSFGEKPDRR